MGRFMDVVWYDLSVTNSVGAKDTDFLFFSLCFHRFLPHSNCEVTTNSSLPGDFRAARRATFLPAHNPIWLTRNGVYMV